MVSFGLENIVKMQDIVLVRLKQSWFALGFENIIKMQDYVNYIYKPTKLYWNHNKIFSLVKSTPLHQILVERKFFLVGIEG
jgi:hypothetical protein